MKNKYNQMISKINLSQEARDRIENAITGNRAKNHKKPSFLRVAAVAACIALLCAVGTVAAVEMLKKPEITDAKTGEDESSFKVKAEVELFKLKDELASLMKSKEQGDDRFAFESKTELEEYVGIKLVDCSVLDQAGIVEDLESSFEHGFDLYPSLEKDADARYVLSMYNANGEECDAEPCVIQINYHRVVNNYEVYVEASIFTDKPDNSKLDSGVREEKFSAASYIISSRYFDASGEIQFDTKNYYDALYSFTTEEYEMKNGNTALIVTAEKYIGIDSGFKEFIGYFVEDGILYSVRPYSVYDPDIKGNYVNGDELYILYEVLDSVK